MGFSYPAIEYKAEGLRSRTAFSLIEIVLALGIVAFVLVALVGLLPVGLNTNRDSLEEFEAFNVLQLAAVDRQSSLADAPSSLFQIPKVETETVNHSFEVERAGIMWKVDVSLRPARADFASPLMHVRVAALQRPNATGVEGIYLLKGPL